MDDHNGNIIKAAYLPDNPWDRDTRGSSLHRSARCEFSRYSCLNLQLVNKPVQGLSDSLTKSKTTNILLSNTLPTQCWKNLPQKIRSRRRSRERLLTWLSTLRLRTGSWCEKLIYGEYALSHYSFSSVSDMPHSLLPVMAVSYMFQFLDKSALAYTSILGLRESLHLSGSQFSWSNSIYYFGYLIASYPLGLLMVRFRVGKVIAISV